MTPDQEPAREEVPTYHLGARIPRALRDRMERIARAHHRPMAAEVRVALERWCSQHEPDAPRQMESSRAEHGTAQMKAGET